MKLGPLHISIINRFLMHPMVHWLTIFFLITFSILLLIPPDILLFKQLTKYATHWMFLCIGFGLIFMLLDINSLLFVSFACAATIALFLHSSFNSAILLAGDNKDESTFSVLYVNPNLSKEPLQRTIKSLLKHQADLIIVDDYHPMVHAASLQLDDIYPYRRNIILENGLGKGMFCKTSIALSDTLPFLFTPSLFLELNINDSIRLTVGSCSHLLPENLDDYHYLSQVLQKLSAKLVNIKDPTILAVNFNIEPWSQELRDFKDMAHLSSSRRENNEGVHNKSILSALTVPGGEILINQKVECSHFSIVSDEQNIPIGLFGKYKIR
ncbi:MAG: hypothetical protein IPO62_02580 [Saprospiraceae bacterium]|nr:hypothetical protein [Saprospiraceae bacterium]